VYGVGRRKRSSGQRAPGNGAGTGRGPSPPTGAAAWRLHSVCPNGSSLRPASMQREGFCRASVDIYPIRCRRCSARVGRLRLRRLNSWGLTNERSKLARDLRCIYLRSFPKCSGLDCFVFGNWKTVPSRGARRDVTARPGFQNRTWAGATIGKLDFQDYGEN
jgi:hypothetical protein